MTVKARALAALVTLLLLVAGPQPGGASGFPSAQAQVEEERWAPTDRLAGDDRYGTAVAIANEAFPEPFPAGTGRVYLARGDVFADALAGGALTDGPVLLVRSCGPVPSAVLAEISRLRPSRVVALGGTEAVCQDVLTRAAQGRPTDRLAGTTRYATAVAISQHAFPRPGVGEVYLGSGADSPDPVAGGVLTAGPVLLVPASGAPRVVRDELARLDPGRVVALGGELAIPTTQLSDLAAGRPTDRLAGANRYATSARIAAHQFPSLPDTAYIARGDVVADAIAGGALTDGPIILLPGACTAEVPLAVQEYLRAAQPARVVALGGTQSVCDDNLRAAAWWARGLHVITDSLPDGVVGEPYEAAVDVGSNSLYWVGVIVEGLPAGLTAEADPTTTRRAWIRGVPEVPGTSPVTVTTHEMWERITTKELTLEVSG